MKRCNAWFPDNESMFKEAPCGSCICISLSPSQVFTLVPIITHPISSHYVALVQQVYSVKRLIIMKAKTKCTRIAGKSYVSMDEFTIRG